MIHVANGKITGSPENEPTRTVVHMSQAGQPDNVEMGSRRERHTTDADGWDEAERIGKAYAKTGCV